MKYLRKLNESKVSELLYNDCKDAFAELLDYNLISMMVDHGNVFINFPYPEKSDNFNKLVETNRKFTEILEDVNVAIKRLGDIYDNIDVAINNNSDLTLYMTIGVELDEDLLIAKIKKYVLEYGVRKKVHGSFEEIIIIDSEDYNDDYIELLDDSEIHQFGIDCVYVNEYYDDDEGAIYVTIGYDELKIFTLLEIIDSIEDAIEGGDLTKKNNK